MPEDEARPGVEAGAPAPEPGQRPDRAAAEASPLRVALRAPLAALTLLTIVPVPAKAQAGIGAREVSASAPFFPLVGAVMGVLIGGVAHAVAAHGTPILAAAVATILLAIVTGALHLDGLADSADALGARGGSRERRLEIMRDSSTGAYGTAAVAGWFVLVAAAIASLPPDLYAVTLGLACALARGSAVGHANILPPARSGGLGASFEMRGAATTATQVMAVLLVAGVATLPPDAGWVSGPSGSALIGAVVGTLAVQALVVLGARRLIGGRTGDTLGATIALVEAAALLSAALTLH